MQFMDLPRKLLLQVVALLVKVPQFEVDMLMCFFMLISQHKEPGEIWQLHEMEESPIDDFYIVSMQCSPRYGSTTLGNPTHLTGGAQTRVN